MVFGSELRTIKLRGVGFVEGFGRWVWMELQLVTSLVQPCVRWFGIHGRKKPQNFLWDFKRNIEQHLTRHICVYLFYIFMLFYRKSLSTLKGGILFLILRNGLRRQIHTHFLYIFVMRNIMLIPRAPWYSIKTELRNDLSINSSAKVTNPFLFLKDS